MFTTTHDRRAEHLDALAAARARNEQRRRRQIMWAAVSRARYRGTCSACIWGSLDPRTGNVAACTCAHPDDHGPAFEPVA